MRDRSAVLTGRVRDLLRGRPVDIDDAGAAFAYRLRQSHVGVVVWVDDGDPSTHWRGCAASCATSAQAVGCEDERLFVAHDEGSAWVWLPTKVDVAHTDELVDVAKAERRVSVAVGAPNRGVEGFRRTHQQAVSAQSVAHAAGTDHAQITPFDEVAPIAMLCADLDVGTGVGARHARRVGRRHDPERRACGRRRASSSRPAAATRRRPSRCSSTATPRSTG